MRILIIWVFLLLVSCSLDERQLAYATVGGEVQPYWFDCKFGVLYDNGKVLFRRDGKPIVCEVVYLNMDQYCSAVKKPAHILGHVGC